LAVNNIIVRRNGPLTYLNATASGSTMDLDGAKLSNWFTSMHETLAPIKI